MSVGIDLSSRPFDNLCAFQPPDEEIESIPGLTDEERAIATVARRGVRQDWPNLRRAYLTAGNAELDQNNNLTSVMLNTDEWRDLFKGYTVTNPNVIHELASYANKKLLAEMLVAQRGKGNNRFAFYAGGGGSGKGTAINDYFTKYEYPLWIDQATDSFRKLEKLLDQAKEHGYEPEYIFIERTPSDAFERVLGQALALRKAGKNARIVPLEVTMTANIVEHGVAIEFLEKRPDANPKILDNILGVGRRGMITDRLQAIGYLKARLKENEEQLKDTKAKARADILERHARGEIPTDIAHGLFGGQKHFEEHQRGAVTNFIGGPTTTITAPIVSARKRPKARRNAKWAEQRKQGWSFGKIARTWNGLHGENVMAVTVRMALKYLREHPQTE
jgi:hypothetical protein